MVRIGPFLPSLLAIVYASATLAGPFDSKGSCVVSHFKSLLSPQSDVTSFTTPLTGKGSNKEKLIAAFVKSSDFMKSSSPEALLKSVLSSADPATQLAVEQAVSGIDHVGFIAPSGTDLSTLQGVAQETGFVSSQRSFASTIVAKELGGHLGVDSVPTQIFLCSKKGAGGLSSGVEVFVPQADSQHVEPWIEQGVGTHIAFKVRNASAVEKIKDSLKANGFKMPEFMGGKPMFNPQQGSTTVYFDLVHDRKRLRIEFVHTPKPLVDYLADDVSQFVERTGRVPDFHSANDDERLNALSWKQGLEMPGFSESLTPEAQNILSATKPKVLERPVYSTVSLHPNFVGEEEGKEILSPVSGKLTHFHTRYLKSEAEREPYKLTFRDGKVYGTDGLPYDTSDAELKALSNSTGRSMLVMDRVGNLYAMKEQVRGLIHHSTLLGGEPVAFAGEFIVEKGVIQLVANKSGHYLTPTGFFSQFLDHLKRQGVDISQIKLDVESPFIPPLAASASDAAKVIPDGAKIFVPIGAGASPQGMAGLIEHAKSLHQGMDVHVMASSVSEDLLREGTQIPGNKFRLHALFLGRNMRKLHAEGGVNVIPGYLSDFPRMVRDPKLPDFHYNAMLLRVSPPDALGRYSLGPNSDLIMSILRERPGVKIVAEINPHVPQTTGHNFLTADRITSSFKSDVPLGGKPEDPVTPVETAIGKNLATLIDNGTHLQIGTGNVFGGFAPALAVKGVKNVTIDTEMLSDPMMQMIKDGVANSATTGFARGSADLYRWLDHNPKVIFEDTEYINSPGRVASIRNFNAVNTALQVNLFGDVNATMGPGGARISSPGGQVEFMSGASRSEGGNAIIAIRSTAMGGKSSSIVTDLYRGPVTTPHEMVSHVVTEYGVAELRGKSVSKRAAALINVAHPDFRRQLMVEALEKGQLRQEDVPMLNLPLPLEEFKPEVPDPFPAIVQGSKQVLDHLLSSLDALEQQFPKNVRIVDNATVTALPESPSNPRQMVFISTKGLDEAGRSALMNAYYKAMGNHVISLPRSANPERLTEVNPLLAVLPKGAYHLMVRKGTDSLDLFMGQSAFQWALRRMPYKMPKTDRIETLLALSPSESKSLDTYIANAEAKPTITVGLGGPLLGTNLFRPQGEGYKAGVKSGRTNGKLDNNRPQNMWQETHNCATWLSTAPIGDSGEALCNLMGSAWDPELARPRNWYNHLISQAPSDRVPAIVYWTSDTLDEAVGRYQSAPQNLLNELRVQLPSVEAPAKTEK